jgi:cysteine synthase B
MTTTLEPQTVRADTLAAAIGHTPLVRLRRFEPRPGVEIHAKLESRNPGGSVKDRAALAIILAGERSGALGHDRILLDATSGNTGIAYAMIGGSRGHRVRLAVPGNINAERQQLLKSYGAELILTDPMDGSDGAIREAQRLHAGDPDRYFYANQYGNPENWRAHFNTTGKEIIGQTAGGITHLVAGLGTSGTFMGVGRRLRAWKRPVTLVAVEPDSPLHGLEGLKHMASAIVPAIYDASLADLHVSVTTEDAHALVRRLAREEGVLAGPSSGAALAACLRLASQVERGVFVCIFPDGGERYLSDPVLWKEPPTIDLRLSPGVRQTMLAHAARTYPDECCGVLLGRARGTVDEAFALENTSTEGHRRRFLIGPAEYHAAEARADARGSHLLGFYHSHPDHPAEPSTFDLDHAWPNLSYLIVSVRAGTPVDARSWRLAPARVRFVEEKLIEGGA